MRLFTAVVVILLLHACKHPLEIQGRGDIVDLNGSGHGCTLEQFQAADVACTENEVLGDYFVKYEAVPRAGWKFVRWEGPCGSASEPPYCQLEFAAALVEAWDAAYGDVPVQPTVAVFEPDSESITYIRSVSTTNFLGWGHAGFYFPQFGAPDIVGPKRTDDNMQFYLSPWLEFNFDPWNFNTTFSADKPDCFDDCSGRGVYTRGGYSNWDRFILPNGMSGLSGSVVDEQAENNTNNTVNRIRLKAGVPDSFCLHLVADNTDNAHDSASLIVRGGRPDQGSFDPTSSVPALASDGVTDVHTFRLDNFMPEDFIKVRLNSAVRGTSPGFGGLMFDASCDYIPNAQCGNKQCDINQGESCESCPGDCGACVAGPEPTRYLYSHGVNPGSHYQEGDNRLLVFIAHGVDDRNHWVEGVRYGNKNMLFLEGRSQDRNDKSTVSVWYLKEADIYSSGGNDFTVDWYHKPGQRSFESIFFTDVSQTMSFGDVDEAGCNDCDAVACRPSVIEPGHLSVYAGTHERDGASFNSLNGYIEDADLQMGGNGAATVGHKSGVGRVETAGARFGREGAFSMVCFEVQDLPQTEVP
jgi:hypothetical protein